VLWFMTRGFPHSIGPLTAVTRLSTNADKGALKDGCSDAE
jgi:hypothetical protein